MLLPLIKKRNLHAIILNEEYVSHDREMENGRWADAWSIGNEISAKIEKGKYLEDTI